MMPAIGNFNYLRFNEPDWVAHGSLFAAEHDENAQAIYRAIMPNFGSWLNAVVKSCCRLWSARRSFAASACCAKVIFQVRSEKAAESPIGIAPRTSRVISCRSGALCEHIAHPAEIFDGPVLREGRWASYCSLIIVLPTSGTGPLFLRHWVFTTSRTQQPNNAPHGRSIFGKIASSGARRKSDRNARLRKLGFEQSSALSLENCYFM